MADVVSPGKRSKMMSGIRGKDTKPELLIRRGLFKRGFRFRLHVTKLPGKPDIVLSKYKSVVLINGCFWHGHGCSIFKWPSTRAEFWKTKIQSNMERDVGQYQAIRSQGWRILIVWECATKGRGKWQEDRLLDAIEGWILKGDGDLEIGEQKNG